MLNQTKQLKSIAEEIKAARRIGVFTGAGISADSGLPTYRGIGGLYNDITIDEGLPIETVLSGEMMSSSPQITWKYIAEIEKACRGAEHNATHEFLASIQELAEIVIITQNVDGFHIDAGSRNVIEMHGNLKTLYCIACRDTQYVSSYDGLTIPPHCKHCGSVVRPDVVLFGEMLPEKAVAMYEQEIQQGFDIVFSIGTTAGFPYIFHPIAEATRIGIPTVEVNPDRTALSELVTFHLEMTGISATTGLRKALN